jgi:hypothetical protein
VPTWRSSADAKILNQEILLQRVSGELSAEDFAMLKETVPRMPPRRTGNAAVFAPGAQERDRVVPHSKARSLRFRVGSPPCPAEAVGGNSCR